MEARDRFGQQQLNSLTDELNRLAAENKQLSEDLNATRIERDDTVSDMRQDIERLNLLQSDQTQLATRAEESEQSFKAKFEQFSTELNQLRVEREELQSRKGYKYNNNNNINNNNIIIIYYYNWAYYFYY